MKDAEGVLGVGMYVLRKLLDTADIGVAVTGVAVIGVAGVSGVFNAPVCPPQVVHMADSASPGVPVSPRTGFPFFPFRRG